MCVVHVATGVYNGGLQMRIAAISTFELNHALVTLGLICFRCTRLLLIIFVPKIVVPLNLATYVLGHL